MRLEDLVRVEVSDKLGPNAAVLVSQREDGSLLDMTIISGEEADARAACTVVTIRKYGSMKDPLRHLTQQQNEAAREWLREWGKTQK